MVLKSNILVIERQFTTADVRIILRCLYPILCLTQSTSKNQTIHIQNAGENMKNIAIILYSKEYEYIRNSLFVNKYDKIELIIPNDISYIKKLGLIDTAIICNNNEVSSEFVVSIIRMIINKVHTIINYYELSDLTNDAIKTETKNNNVEYICFNYRHRSLTYNGIVIYITGMGNECDQYITHIMVEKYFKENGYSVLNLSTNKYGELYNYISINNIPDNISTINDFIESIKEILISKIDIIKPDVIIIDDYGVMPFDDVNTNNFGIFNQVLKDLLVYDLVILNIYSMEYSDSKSFVSLIKNQCCCDNIVVGLSHSFVRYVEDGSRYQHMIYKICDEDYANLKNNYSNSIYPVIDTISEKDIYELFSNYEKND